MLSSYYSLTHPYVLKRRSFLLRPRIPQRNNWWDMNHFISLKESGLVLYSCIFWSFLTFNDIHMVPPRISVMRDTGTVWNNQSLFFRKIQKLRSRKPINIWCLDRCSLKYSFPQVKLLSMLLIKRLQKEYFLSFFFPLSLVVFYYYFMKNRSHVHLLCLHVCVFHKIKKEDREKKKKIN